eukprot:11204668-Lingulodinium_polyedra.AAC.1
MVFVLPRDGKYERHKGVQTKESAEAKAPVTSPRRGPSAVAETGNGENREDDTGHPHKDVCLPLVGIAQAEGIILPQGPPL